MKNKNSSLTSMHVCCFTFYTLNAQKIRKSCLSANAFPHARMYTMYKSIYITIDIMTLCKKNVENQMCIWWHCLCHLLWNLMNEKVVLIWVSGTVSVGKVYNQVKMSYRHAMSAIIIVHICRSTEQMVNASSWYAFSMAVLAVMAVVMAVKAMMMIMIMMTMTTDDLPLTKLLTRKWQNSLQITVREISLMFE